VNVDPEPIEGRDEPVVLALGTLEVDRSEEAVRRVLERSTEGRTRSLDEDVPKVRGHALGAVAPLGKRHRRRIPSADRTASAALRRRRRLVPMRAYAATARIERIAPHMRIDRSNHGAVGAWVVESDITDVEVAAVDDADPFVDRLTAISERWSQLTFFLFNAEGWR